MGSGCVCETSVWLPRFHIPHHPRAKISTTTEPSANNLRAIWFRCWLWLVAWNLALSSCVELTPRRETDGDESAMNLSPDYSRSRVLFVNRGTRFLASRAENA